MISIQYTGTGALKTDFTRYRDILCVGLGCTVVVLGLGREPSWGCWKMGEDLLSDITRTTLLMDSDRIPLICS